MHEEQKIINGIPIVDQWRSYWLWLPTLYLTRGLPYVILLMTSLVYFNRMGLSNGAITLTTSWLILPFILRPLLGRLVVGYWSKYAWIILTEFVMALSLRGLAFMASSVDWYEWTVFFLMIIATMAALHDVAIERLYKREMALHNRPAFIGTRAISYMLSIIVGMAIPVTIAGNLEVIYRTVAPSWATIFRVLSGLLTCLMLLHAIILPKDNIHANLPIWTGVTRQWWHDVKAAFVRRPHYVANLCFLFAFLIPEGMFFRIAPLFLIDPGSNAGLALSPQELGLVLGTVGTFSLIGGSALGANLVRCDGFKGLLLVFCYSLDLAKVCLCLSQLLLCLHLIDYQFVCDYRTVWSRFGINVLCCMARSLYKRGALHIYLFNRYGNNSLLVGDDRMVYRFLAGVCGLSSILPSCSNIGCYQLYSDLLSPCNRGDR